MEVTRAEEREESPALRPPALHPVRTAIWALSPKPVKKARRAAFKVAHPGEAVERQIEDQVVRSVRG